MGFNGGGSARAVVTWGLLVAARSSLSRAVAAIRPAPRPLCAAAVAVASGTMGMESHAIRVGVAVAVAPLPLRGPSQCLSAAAVLFWPSPCPARVFTGSWSNVAGNSVPRTTGARALMVAADGVKTGLDLAHVRGAWRGDWCKCRGLRDHDRSSQRSVTQRNARPCR